MKIFVYDWIFITKYDLYKAMQKQRLDYSLFSCKFSPRKEKEKEQFVECLKEALNDENYDIIFSINFFDVLAIEAKERGILYICWTYDSPAFGTLTEPMTYDTNRIFVFDSDEYETYKPALGDNLYYLPLAVNSERLSKIKVSQKQKEKYRADISFVGRLYDSDMDKVFPLFEEYNAGYMAALINSQLNVYNNNFLGEILNDNLVDTLCNEKVKEAILKNMNNGFYQGIKEICATNLEGFLLKSVTNKERVLILSLLARYFNVKLYTVGKADIANVNNMGIVDYETEMPIVFKCSKINLNITLRNIRAGIPQRVIDIMGAGGLVLTNHQKDMDNYFKDGRDILTYSSVEEAFDKCRYYLENEDKAEKIKLNGYNIAKEKFSYDTMLSEIWEKSGIKIKG